MSGENLIKYLKKRKNTKKTIVKIKYLMGKEKRNFKEIMGSGYFQKGGYFG